MTGDGFTDGGPGVAGLERKDGRVFVEICVTSVEDAVVAEAAGADRVEVCSALVEGGVTPSIGLVGAILDAVDHIGVQVLIRPRGGDFLYAEREVEVMVRDIAAFLALVGRGQSKMGFVLGALAANGTVDEGVTARLLTVCDGAPVTFHRAFDFTSDLGRSLDSLVDLGVRRVLTGGGCQRAIDGAESLSQLVRRAGPRLSVMAGGAVRAGNVGELVKRTGVREVHLRAAHEVASGMEYRRAGLSLSSSMPPEDYFQSAISAESVSAVRRALSAPVSG